MTEDQDDILSEIRRALAVDPSPDFGARVRARTARAHRLARVMWVSGLAALAAAVAMVAIVWPSRGTTPQQPAFEGSEIAGATPNAPTAMAAAGRETLPDALRSSEPVVREHASSGTSLMRVDREPRVTRPNAVTFETLVPRDQAIAIGQLMMAVSAGHTPTPVVEEIVDDGRDALPAPAAVDVPALSLTAFVTDQGNEFTNVGAKNND